VLPLGVLSEREAEAYLSASLEAEPDPELLRVVAAVTQGHPLHLRSLTLQSGLRAGGLRGGLEQAIGGVLGQLSESDRRLVAVAALLGPEVSVHEVARVAVDSPAAAAEAMVQAVRLGLATEGEGGRFAFVHDLVRQSALSALALVDRLELHVRAVALLTS